MSKTEDGLTAKQSDLAIKKATRQISKMFNDARRAERNQAENIFKALQPFLRGTEWLKDKHFARARDTLDKFEKFKEQYPIPR